MFAGAAGAVAAGGAAAYMKRDKLTEGWGWIGSHLEFVGCLARPEDLKTRLERMADLSQEKGVGFRDVVTVLGKNANHAAKKEREPVQFGPGGMVEIGGPDSTGKERTFCSMPKTEGMGRWFEKSINDHAHDETEAHMTMFERKGNSHYYALTERAKELVVSWVEDSEWYKSSEARSSQEKDGMKGERTGSTGESMDGDVNLGVGGIEMAAARPSSELMDVDLNEEDDKGKEWATGEEPVWVSK